MMTEHLTASGRTLEPALLRGRLRHFGGFTMDLANGRCATTGLSVAVAPELSLSFPEPEWDDRCVARWLAEVTSQRGRALIGGWRDEATDVVHLDVVEVVTSADDAVRLGLAARQRWVFDLDRGHLVAL